MAVVSRSVLKEGGKLRSWVWVEDDRRDDAESLRTVLAFLLSPYKLVFRSLLAFGGMITGLVWETVVESVTETDTVATGEGRGRLGVCLERVAVTGFLSFWVESFWTRAEENKKALGTIMLHASRGLS
jgi:hypothetical protein